MQMLVTAVLTATTDAAVADAATEFTTDLFTHLALLYTSGRTRSQYELGISGPWSSTLPRFSPLSVPNPRELNMRAALHGLVAVLTMQDERGVQAAVKALDSFVAAVMLATEARRAVQASMKEVSLGAASGAGAARPSADTMQGDAAGAEEGGGGGERAEATASEGTMEASEKPSTAGSANSRGGAQDTELKKIRPPRVPIIAPAVQAKLPPVLDDVMSLLLHACHGVLWAARVGGIAGLKIVSKRLPTEYLKPWAPQMVAAVANVLSGLPEHSTTEKATVTKLLHEVVLKTVGLPLETESPGQTAGDSDAKVVAAVAQRVLVRFLACEHLGYCCLVPSQLPRCLLERCC
jgi:hypothetical protein